jgi:hypothetical protein
MEYTYWDGINVVKKLRRKKRESIRELLEVSRIEIIENFQNVAAVEAKDLLFVIKDFIVPHEMSLADIELLQLKTTKNDPLLNLRHVKIRKDSRELTLSVNLDGPARIIERARYEKHKATFPFCNWHSLTLDEK